MFTFHVFKAWAAACCRLHHRSPKSFNVDVISSLYFLKSVLEGNLYFRLLETMWRILESEMICVAYGLVILITDNWRFRSFEIRRYRWSDGSILKNTMQVIKFNAFIYKWNFYKMPFVLCFSIDKWTKNMLNITCSQKRSIIQWMIYVLEFISLSL